MKNTELKKVKLPLFFITLIILGILLGFSVANDNLAGKKDKIPQYSRIEKNKSEITNPLNIFRNLINSENDNNGILPQIFGSPYFTDNFNGSNDTSSLKARGYKVYFRGTGVQNTGTATWFQGNPLVFSAFNGPSNGYLAGFYQVVTGINNIDNWLILPSKNVSLLDSIFFYQRSQFDPTYPDSIKVMYSAIGDSVPEAASWVELGRLRANYSSDEWKRAGFKALSSGANARYAIRYSVVNSGPAGVNGNYIGIDAISLESPQFIEDVGMISINSPAGTIALPSSSVIPSATIKNFGLTEETFNITMKISPGGYSSTKTITNLSPGSTQNLNFDNYTPVTGSYSITTYTELETDYNLFNDTLKTTFSVMQPNYGGGTATNGGYYFANSTANAYPAPSHPVYSKADTTGSTTLVLNNIPVVSLSRGDLDDGHWAFSGLGGIRKIKFMGNFYDSVFIGTNGIICFTNFVPDQSNWSPPLNGLPGNGSGGVSRPGIYPLWNDIDWSNTNQPNNRLSYKIDAVRNLLIVNYDKAPVFNGASTSFQSFQVLIEFQENLPESPNSNIVFSYDNSSASLSIPMLIGLQNATGSEYLQYSFKNSLSSVVTPGPIYDSASSGVTVSFGPDANKLLGNYKSLNLTAIIQGFWNGVTNTGDTLSVQIRQTFPPYNIAEISKGKTNSAGNVLVNFANALTGTPYYLVIKHRNSIETWSKLNGEIWTGSAYFSYNFTDSLSKAFGNNLVLNSGKYCIWSGDVNQDGAVDAGDISGIENSIGLEGYIFSDINGDNIVDASDLSLVENNSILSPIIIRP